jgi:hypothetical protein
MLIVLTISGKKTIDFLLIEKIEKINAGNPAGKPWHIDKKPFPHDNNV